MDSSQRLEQVVVPPGWLGDAILALPAIRSLATLGTTLLLAHPRVEALYRLALPEIEVARFDAAAHAPRGIAQALRARRREPRRAVLFPRSFSSALRGRIASRGRRIGFGGGFRAMLLDRRIVPDWPLRSRHIDLEFALLARAAGAPEPDPTPRIAIPPALDALARERLRELGADEGRPLVAACPGAAYGPAKRWFASRFAEVLSRAARDGGATLLLGSESDRSSAGAVRDAADPPPFDLCGRTDLPLFAALLARARVALVNDSGPMHLAAAVGTPVVALFGSTNPDWTRPRGDGHALLRYPVPCSPCYRRRCPIGRACFDGIGAGEAYEAVAARLSLGARWYTPAR